MKKAMKILILFNHQLSAECLSGGEKMFIEVSRRFSPLGVDSCSVVPAISVKALEREEIRTRFFTIPCFAFEYGSYTETTSDLLRVWLVLVFRTLYSSLKVFGWLKRSGADIIYSTGDFLPDTVPAVLARLVRRKVRWIMLIHHIIESPGRRKTGSVVSNTASYLMQRLSFGLIKIFADGVFVKNRLVKDELVRRGFRPSRVFVIDNGIDLERIEGMPSDCPEPFDACYIGRLAASKGIADLVKAWELVIEEIPAARLAVIGGGSESLEEEKKREVREKGLEGNIKILGSLSDEDAYRIRKTSRLALSCSYEEGWGITIAESLACGVPCVVYDLPVYEEKFKGAVETVPRGDVRAFAEAVVRNLKDGDKRQRMAALGREVVRKYEINTIVRKEVEVMRGILLNSSGGAKGIKDLGDVAG